MESLRPLSKVVQDNMSSGKFSIPDTLDSPHALQPNAYSAIHAEKNVFHARSTSKLDSTTRDKNSIAEAMHFAGSTMSAQRLDPSYTSSSRQTMKDDPKIDWDEPFSFDSDSYLQFPAEPWYSPDDQRREPDCKAITSTKVDSRLHYKSRHCVQRCQWFGSLYYTISAN